MSRRHTALNRKRWARVRRHVLDRDNWRCQSCGGYGREVDHIRPLQKFPDQDPYDPNGLQTLCRNCHIKKSARENRKPVSPERQAWLDLIST